MAVCIPDCENWRSSTRKSDTRRSRPSRSRKRYVARTTFTSLVFLCKHVIPDAGKSTSPSDNTELLRRIVCQNERHEKINLAWVGVPTGVSVETSMDIKCHSQPHAKPSQRVYRTPTSQSRRVSALINVLVLPVPQEYESRILSLQEQVDTYSMMSSCYTDELEDEEFGTCALTTSVCAYSAQAQKPRALLAVRALWCQSCPSGAMFALSVL